MFARRGCREGLTLQMASLKPEQIFTAAVKLDGINPYVDVPVRVVKGLGGEAKARVLLKVVRVHSNGKPAVAPNRASLAKDASRLKAIGRLAPGGWFRTTLVPLRSSPTRLYLDTWMRMAAGVVVGNRVRITLRPDRASRELPMPRPLRDALHENPDAKAAWDALAPSRRREILSYLNSLKSTASIERNVRNVVATLLSSSHPRTQQKEAT